MKERFLYWMNEDKTKIDKIFTRLEAEVKEDFEKRSKPFDMVKTNQKFDNLCKFLQRNSALFNIIPLIDQLKRKDQLPALCFNDDREICEHLAIHAFNELQKREDAYKASEEFKRRYKGNLKAEEVLIRIF